MSKWNLKGTILKCIYTGLLALVVLLQGCATTNTGSFEHGINISNYGAQWIYDIKIFYGKKIIPAEFLRASNPLGGFGWNAPMPIPEEMTVIWHIEKDGPEHRITIPLKDKISRTNPLANWKIRFYDDHIELWREDDIGPLNPHTMIWPRETKKVFP